jgi:sugar (pentulose or hexulose) kinase
LHYLETLSALEGATLLPYAQYWAWLLSGVAVSEVTSLGCHSDLWAPGESDYSPMAKRRGWAARFAPMARAGDVIGTLRPELAERTGLSPQVNVYAGLHDSNAALHAARGFAELAGVETTVLSTGTWFIAMRLSGEPVDLTTLPESRDCLVNVDIHGNSVASARYMGGRELELLGAQIDHAGTDGLTEVLHSGAMLLPSQVPNCGPFPESKGRWIDEPSNPTQRNAAAALFAALMADASLDLIGAKERLLIEGRFARSEIFTRAIAALRPGTQVYTASREADLSFGALRLVFPELAPMESLTQVTPLTGDIAAYKSCWNNQREGKK